jgi:hypothetical protein
LFSCLFSFIGRFWLFLFTFFFSIFKLCWLICVESVYFLLSFFAIIALLPHLLVVLLSFFLYRSFLVVLVHFLLQHLQTVLVNLCRVSIFLVIIFCYYCIVTSFTSCSLVFFPLSVVFGCSCSLSSSASLIYVGSVVWLIVSFVVVFILLLILHCYLVYNSLSFLFSNLDRV